MKQTRKRPLLHRSDSGTRKVARTAKRRDKTTALNQTEISNLVKGKDDEVERCFPAALDNVDHKAALSVLGSNQSIDGFGRVAKNLKNNKIAAATSQCRSNGGNGIALTRSSSKTVSTLLYIYQRQEYDEGMYVYSKALPFCDDHRCECIRSATLLFNDGQTYVRQAKYDEARIAFELALARILTIEMTSDTLNEFAAVVSIKINHNLGYCHYRLGKNEEALQHYQKAYHKAFAVTKNSLFQSFHVAAAINSIAVLHFHSERSDCNTILNLFKVSLSIYRTRLGSEARVATILNNIGRVYYLNSDYKAALEVYKESLRIRQNIPRSCSLDMAATICNTGQTHHQLGELDEAMAAYRIFLDLAGNYLGSNNRDIAAIYKCMAEIHQERQELDDAQCMYERALQTGRAALGPHHPELVSTLNKLGNLHNKLGNLDKALNYYNDCLEVEKINLDSSHPHIILTLMNIAKIHRLRNNFGAALIKYSDVYSLQLQSPEANRLEVVFTLSNMALMLYQLKRYDASLELYQGALCIQRDHYGSDENLEVATTLNSIGLVLFNQHFYIPAKRCFQESLRIRQKILGPDHPDVAILWYNIATIYLETGEDETAIEMYKKTLGVERKALGYNHPDVILTLQHLGLVYQQRGELEEALGFFEKALELERTKNGSSRIAMGKLLNVIGNIHLQKADVDSMMDCYTQALRIYREQTDQNATLFIAGLSLFGLSKLHPACAAMA